MAAQETRIHCTAEIHVICGMFQISNAAVNMLGRYELVPSYMPLVLRTYPFRILAVKKAILAGFYSSSQKNTWHIIPYA